jgi:hypothetical protein
MFDKFKTRKGRLENKIKSELENDSPEFDNIISAVDTYEKDNTDTIEKLKKDKKADMVRINGALKQTINAHGPITKQLIGSAGKRIYGSLILNPNQQEKKKPMKVSLRDVLIGVVIGIIFTIITQIV